MHVYISQEAARDDPDVLILAPLSRYASAKIACITRGGGFDVHQDRKLYFVIECKQKGGPLYAGGFHKCGETIGWEESHLRGSRISPHFDNGEIEYYSLRQNSVVPYRVLVLTDDVKMVEVSRRGGVTPIMIIKQDELSPKRGTPSAPGLHAAAPTAT